MEWITAPEAWIALSTLTLMEIVLGIDNIVFISILASRLKPSEQNTARYGGLFLALCLRIVLLFSISWLMSLSSTLFRLFSHDFSGRDLILIFGGLFLIGKATLEIHEKLEGEAHEENTNQKTFAKLSSILMQIVLLDMVFSLDSVITAIGMAERIQIMIIAVVISIVFMMFSMKAISRFVEKHPTVKMLALSFLVLIGVTLIGEGLRFHISKGYVYFAMGFSLFVEFLNMKLRKTKDKPIKLRRPL